MDKALTLAMPMPNAELFAHIRGEQYLVVLCTCHEAMVGSYHLLENGEVLPIIACLSLLSCTKELFGYSLHASAMISRISMVA